jgi:hypothetical protein
MAEMLSFDAANLRAAASTRSRRTYSPIVTRYTAPNTRDR